MNILDIIRNRRSVREFTGREIPDSSVDALIEALRWAPSAGNLQSRKFYFVFNKEKRTELSQAGFRHDFVSFIAKAPLVVAACADHWIVAQYKERGRSLYCIQDTAASIQNMLLAAYDLGLGTCWVGAFREEEVQRILGLPDHLRPVAVIPVGYPAHIPKAPERIAHEALVELVR